MNFFDWLWAHPMYILWIFLGIMTLVCFFAMGLDKLKAKKGKRRIPESSLMLLAVFGGSVGGIIGTYVFRHKTLHKKFTIGMPVILALQIALSIFIYNGLSK